MPVSRGRWCLRGCGTSCISNGDLGRSFPNSLKLLNHTFQVEKLECKLKGFSTSSEPPSSEDTAGSVVASSFCKSSVKRAVYHRVRAFHSSLRSVLPAILTLLFSCVCLNTQVYQAGTGQLMFMNKYHGRKLSVQGFKEALYQFFHNGKYLRRELFESVIKKLTELKSVLEKQESYRFYSSSLLIIYDGKERQEVAVDSDPEDLEDLSEESSDESAGAYAYKPTASTVDVRMIDFAHTTCKYYGEDSVVHEGQDTGYVFGLQNLIDIIKEIRDENSE